MPTSKAAEGPIFLGMGPLIPWRVYSRRPGTPRMVIGGPRQQFSGCRKLRECVVRGIGESRRAPTRLFQQLERARAHHDLLLAEALLQLLAVLPPPIAIQM